MGWTRGNSAIRQLAAVAVVLLSALALSGLPATSETLTPAHALGLAAAEAAPANAQLPPEILAACRNNPLARSMTAYGGEPERERGQLREPGRVAAGGRDAGGVCGDGGDDGGGRPVVAQRSSL